MRAWLAQHWRGLYTASARLAGSPLNSVLNMLVIAVALALPLFLYVAIENLQAASRHFSGTPQISVFMALDASRADVTQVEARIKHNPRVARFRYVGRDQALQELKASSGLADVIDGLPRNPLPDAFVVEARDATVQTLESLRDEFKQWPRVAHVQLDAAWARRLDAALRMGKVLTALLAGVLAFALVAVVFNTIRLQVLTRRDEIEVTRLIGATNAFINRPFLYFGTMQGLAGAVMAWAMVAGGIWMLNRSLGELSHVYSSLIQLRPPNPGAVGALFLTAAGLGWLGARLSVGRAMGRLDS